MALKCPLSIFFLRPYLLNTRTCGWKKNAVFNELCVSFSDITTFICTIIHRSSLSGHLLIGLDCMSNWHFLIHLFVVLRSPCWELSKIFCFASWKRPFYNLLKNAYFSKNFMSTLKNIFERIKKITHNPTNLANKSLHKREECSSLIEHRLAPLATAWGCMQGRNRKIFAFQLETRAYFKNWLKQRGTWQKSYE